MSVVSKIEDTLDSLQVLKDCIESYEIDEVQRQFLLYVVDKIKYELNGE